MLREHVHLTHPNLFDECERLYMINHRISFYLILHYVSNIIWYYMGFFFYKYGIALNRDKKSYDIIFNIQYDIIIINLRPLYQYIRSLSGIWILVIDGTAILVRFCGLKYSTRNFAGKTLLWERKDDFMIIFKSTYQNSYVSLLDRTCTVINLFNAENHNG